MVQSLNIESITTQATSGFAISGEYYYSDTGASVSSTDINNDGYTDVIIGSWGAASFAGRVYVVYGSSAPNNIDLAALTLEQGFYIGYLTGSSTSKVGKSVSDSGDVNKDGYADIVIRSDYNAFVIYGNNTLNNIDLSTLTSAQGFSITGLSSSGSTSSSVSGIGDLNKDGFADIIVGDYVRDKAYVIYGSAALSNIDLSTLTSTQGFSITGASGSTTGYAVSGAGDINNDGFVDIIISAYGINTVYVIYGSITLSNINLATLTSTQGIIITGIAGSTTGWSVSDAGDINNDGYDDIIIGAQQANTAYIIYGNETLSNIDLSSLTSEQGFSLVGTSESLGYSVSDAGDVNGDDIDDIIIGAPGANSGAGRSYVIYGSSDFSSLKGSIINGLSGTRFGYSVSDAGDVNKDGFADFIGGAPFTNSDQGAAYVIYGAPTAVPTTSPTLYPTSMPTKIPTNIPTVSPTANPTSSPTSEYIGIDVTTGGTYTGTSAKENFIVDSSEDTTITGEGGADMFTIMVHPAVNTTITDFNNTNELIDLTAFTDINGIDDFSITSGSAIINLDNNQKVILENLNPSDITADNFIFAPVPESDGSDENLDVDYGLIIGTTIGGAAILGIAGYAVFAYMNNFCPFTASEPLAKMSEMA